MRVRILEWFGGRFGVPFGSLLGSFLDTLGPLGHPLGYLWATFEFFECLFQHFSLLLGAFGHSGVPFCPLVSPLNAFGVISGYFGRILQMFRCHSSGIPQIFLRYS